jgi:hypothetical protein
VDGNRGKKVNKDGLTIGRKFLEDIDKFIANHYQTLKCDDIQKIYEKFFNDLKDFRGSSSGFTGLSELLIFRLLYHQLGGQFKEEDFKKTTMKWFVSTTNNLKIGQNIPIQINGKDRRPDIAIFHDNNELMGIVQIKIYPADGIKEVKEEIKTLEIFKKLHSNLHALLIIFYEPSKQKKGKIIPELERQKRDKKWFNFIILQGNDRILANRLHQDLCLQESDRTSAPSR